MKLVYYIYWRAFNIGKQKGYFLENISLLISLQLITIFGCLIILIDNIFDSNIRSLIPDLRQKNLSERVIGIIFILSFCFLIFRIVKSYFTATNNYADAIKKYDNKYKRVKSSIFLFYFILITFTVFFSLWIIGSLIRQ